jgi:hypothetical protein
VGTDGTVVVDIAFLLLSRQGITATVKFVLATTERDPKCGPRIVPTGDAFFSAHHPASAAFKASGIFEVDGAVLQPVTAGRTHDETNLGCACCTNSFIDQNVGMAFVHTELV